LTTITIIPTAK